MTTYKLIQLKVGANTPKNIAAIVELRVATTPGVQALVATSPDVTGDCPITVVGLNAPVDETKIGPRIGHVGNFAVHSTCFAAIS